MTAPTPAWPAGLAQMLHDTMASLVPGAPPVLLQQLGSLWGQQLASSSAKSYLSKFALFSNFCAQFGLRALPAAAATIYLFIGWLSASTAINPEYFPQYVSAVRGVHNLLLLPVPPVDVVNKALLRAAVRNAAARGSKKVDKIPLPAGAVVQAVQAALSCQDLGQLRCHVFFILKYVTGVRGASLQALCWGDLHCTPTLLQVVWRAEKQRGHKVNGRPVQISLPRFPALHVILDKYRVACSLAAGGAVLGRMWEIVSLPAFGAASKAFPLWLTLLRFPAPSSGVYSGHSTRSGFAAACRGLGVDLEVLCQVAGWAVTSPTVFKYLAHVCPADQHAFCLFAGLMGVLQQAHAVNTLGDVRLC